MDTLALYNSFWLGCIIAYLILTLLVAIAWHDKGRGGVSGFFISLLFTPVFALLLLIAMGENAPAIERRQLHYHERKQCQHCKELIRDDATKCRYCHEPSK